MARDVLYMHCSCNPVNGKGINNLIELYFHLRSDFSCLCYAENRPASKV